MVKPDAAAAALALLKSENWAAVAALPAGETVSPADVVYRAVALAHLGRLGEVDLAALRVALADAWLCRLFRQLGPYRLARDGKVEAALIFAELLAAVAPEHGDAASLLARLRRRATPLRGRRELQALARNSEWGAILRAASERPDDPEARAFAVVAVAHFGRFAEIDRAALTGFLGSAENRAIVRRFGAIELERAGRLNEAVAVTQALADAAPDSVEERLALVRVLRIAGRPEAAEAEIERIGALNPAAVAAPRITRRLQDKRIAEAAELARASASQCCDDPRLALLCITALVRDGDAAGAVAIIDALGDSIVDPALACAAHAAMMLARRAGASLRLTLRVLAIQPTPRLHLAAAEAMLALDKPREEVVVQLEAARAGAAADPMILKPLGEALMSLARYAEAAEALAAATAAAPQNRDARLLQVRALRFARRFDEAADLMMTTRAEFEGSAGWHRDAAGALLLAGRGEEASAVYAEGLARRRGGLAGDLATQLDRLQQTDEPRLIPRARLDFAWKIATRVLGRVPSADRSAWERAARWGLRADKAILDWLECRPEQTNEVVRLFDLPQDEIAAAFRILDVKRGLLFASAHVGPIYAGPVVLKAAGFPFRLVASTPRVSAAHYVTDLISTVDSSEASVVRNILATLGEGKVVTIAVDGAMSPSTPRTIWEGASVTYSDIVAALSLRLRTASIFAQPYWRDGRIAFDLQPLPFPREGETAEDFYPRWREAYFGHVGRYFTRGPENLRLSGGVWREIAASHAE